MIVVTGGLGFIGQNLVQRLKDLGYEVLVFDTKTESRSSIMTKIMDVRNDIDFVFHLGAITDTTETDVEKLDLYNYAFSVFIWTFCIVNDIPLVYASTAAIYGDGSYGFNEKKDPKEYIPLNLYGISKQKFDTYVLNSVTKPPNWWGLRFFNVYGFGEKDKGSMASMIYHGFNQINETNEIKLFRSYVEGCDDGEQKRDFIYVDDVVNACIFFMENKPQSGIYNVGTGKARSFNDLAKSIFKVLGKEEKITYIDMPESIKNQYQYFTQADIDKLRKIGLGVEFHELEEGISKYIQKLKNA